MSITDVRRLQKLVDEFCIVIGDMDKCSCPDDYNITKQAEWISNEIKQELERCL